MRITKDNIEFIQKFFNNVYMIISYMIVAIICLILTLAIINVFMVIYNQFSDNSFLLANDKNPNYIFSKYNLFNYIHKSYDDDDFNIFDMDTFMYIQPYFLNMAAIFIIFVIIIGIINVVFLIAISLNLENNDGDNNINIYNEATKNIKNTLMFGILFVISIWITYLFAFNMFVFEPLKKSYNDLGQIDELIDKTIIKDKEVIDEGLKISPLTALKSYVQQLDYVSVDNATKILFTFALLSYVKKSITSLNNPEIMNRITSYFKDPINNERKDMFYAFTCDKESITGCIVELNTETINSIFDDKLRNRNSDLIKIKSNVHAKLNDVANYIQYGSSKLDNDVHVKVYAFIVLFICILVLSILSSFIFKVNLIEMYNSIKNKILNIASNSTQNVTNVLYGKDLQT